MQPVELASAPTPLTLSGEGEQRVLAGPLGIHTLTQAREALQPWLKKQGDDDHPLRRLDLQGISSLDTSGALFLRELSERGVELIGVRAEHRVLLQLVDDLEFKPLPKLKAVPHWRQLVIQLGRGAEAAWRDSLAIVSFIGRAASALVDALLHPGSLRWPSISRHVLETGISALPIIGLMGVMMSIVIGYQGIAQLRPYGSEDFTINLVAVSVLREMGVLITAIMVAGRSGSAFSAEIGVMKAREEIDALTVMGLDPMQVLVVPRLIALIITLPLLAFFADIMGLLGGAVICRSLLDISPLLYLQRVHEAVDLSDFAVGLIKAPVFAFFIAIIGCMHGLRVRGSSESVGQETTRAVVKAIFLVLVLDALFSILFEWLGV